MVIDGVFADVAAGASLGPGTVAAAAVAGADAHMAAHTVAARPGDSRRGLDTADSAHWD